MLIREAIIEFVKVESRLTDWTEGTQNSKLSALRTFHKLKLGIATGNGAREADKQISHDYYLGMPSGYVHSPEWEEATNAGLKVDTLTTYDITKADCYAFIDERRANVAKTSQKKSFTHVRTFIDWLLDEKLTGPDLLTNPMRRVKDPLEGRNIDASREPRVNYKEDKVKEILLASMTINPFKPLHRYYFSALLNLLDRRVSELALLKWDLIDLERGRMRYWDKKNKKWDYYPFNGELLGCFKAYKEWYQDECDDYMLGDIDQNASDWYVFCFLDYRGDVKEGRKRNFILRPNRGVGTATMGGWYKEVLIAAGHYVKGQVCHTARHHQANQQMDTFQKDNRADADKLAARGAGHIDARTFNLHYRDQSKEADLYEKVVKESTWYTPQFREGLPGLENYQGPIVERKSKKKDKHKKKKPAVPAARPEPEEDTYVPWTPQLIRGEAS